MPDSVLQRPALPLLKILESHMLPLWDQGGMGRCLVAPHDLSDKAALQKWLATGASVTAAPYKGPRIAVKGPRNYGKRNTNLAYWPEDGLRERTSFAIVSVLRGTTDFRLGDKMVHCTAGHSLFILPGTPAPDGSAPHIAQENRGDGYCDLLWIGGGSNNGIGCWICHSEGERHFERPGESCHLLEPSIGTLMEAFLLEASERSGNYQEVCQWLMHSLLLAICRDIREDRIFLFSRQKPEEASNEPQRNPIELAQEYIKNHLHQPLQLGEVARRFHVSRTEFIQEFRRQTGTSFHQFLTEVRLQEACQLLQSTDCSIHIVSQAVSFKSSRLRVLFNRYYGMSPQQYRKQSRLGEVERREVENNLEKMSDGDVE